MAIPRPAMIPLSDIDVVVLCGGMGTRLQAVVQDRPKPMADISGRPFLQLLIEHVAAVGFRRFVLCVGYKAEAIESFWESRPQDYRVEFSRETAPMGTAGALWNARDKIRSDPFLVLNGDSFCGVDHVGMLACHDARGAQATLAVVPVPKGSDYGCVEFDADGRIRAFREKRPQAGESWVNGGVYACTRPFLDATGGRIPLSLERDVFPRLVADGTIYAYRAQGPLVDIGTPERYAYARRQLLTMMRVRPDAAASAETNGS